jgi:hypothetical protein
MAEALSIEMCDGSNNIDLEIGCQAGVRNALRTLVTTSDEAGMAGTARDVIWGELFSWQALHIYNTASKHS